MKCFYHDDRDAVGTCKSCGKGLCRECAVDLGNGLACRDLCEEKVAALNSLIDQNVKLSPVGKNVLGNMRKNTFISAMFFLASGLVFFVTSLASGRMTEPPGLLTLLLGIVLLSFGCNALWRASRIPKQKE